MSDTRLINKALKNARDQNFFREYGKESFIGGFSGTLASLAMFGVDKLVYVYSTLRQTTPPTLKEVAKVAGQTKLKGFGISLIYNAFYGAIMFPVKHQVKKTMEQWNPGSAFNKPAGGFAGGFSALLITYPLSVSQAWRFEGKPVSTIMMMMMRPENFYKGINAACLSDGIFFGVYFGLGPVLSRYLTSLSASKSEANYIADTAAAMLGGIACNPLSVVSMCQRTSQKNMFAETVSLYKEGGVPRFYRGLGTVGLFSIGLYGLVAGACIRYAEKVYERRFRLE